MCFLKLLHVFPCRPPYKSAPIGQYHGTRRGICHTRWAKATICSLNPALVSTFPILNVNPLDLIEVNEESWWRTGSSIPLIHLTQSNIHFYRQLSKQFTPPARMLSSHHNYCAFCLDIPLLLTLNIFCILALTPFYSQTLLISCNPSLQVISQNNSARLFQHNLELHSRVDFSAAQKWIMQQKWFEEYWMFWYYSPAVKLVTTGICCNYNESKLDTVAQGVNPSCEEDRLWNIVLSVWL